MGTVLLVRHGETTWNRSGRVQGWAPVGLTDRGREQARALASYVAGDYRVDRVVSSDLHRARQTSRRVAESVGEEPTFDAAWRERDFGCMQGLTKQELFGDHPEFALSTVGSPAASRRPDSGESVLDVRDRVVGAWERLCDGLGADETVLVVGHGGPNRLVLGHLDGLDVVESMLDVEQDNCALNEIRVESDARPVSVNVTSFLPPELQTRSDNVA